MADPTPPKLAEQIQPYFDWKRRQGRSEGTITTYRSALKRLQGSFPDAYVRDFEPKQGSDLLRQFLSDRSLTSFLREHAALTNFFRWCVQQELLIGDPMVAIPRPKPPKTKMQVIPPAAVGAIINAGRYANDRLMLRVLFEVPMKQLELIRLQVRDYDQLHGTLTIHDPKNRERVVPVRDRALQTDLKAYVDSRYATLASRASAQDTRRVEGEYLLYREYTGPEIAMTPSVARKWWARMLEGAEMPHRYTMFDVRHTAFVNSTREPDRRSHEALMRAAADAPEAYRDYLTEAIGCLDHGYYRAAVLMVWNAVMQHLYGLVEQEPRRLMPAFEAENYRRSKDGQARGYRELKRPSDLRYLGDQQFIELAEPAGLYDRNARRMLEQHITLRNFCGHPTGARPGEAETTNFVETLIRNIIDPNGMVRRPRRP